jgi:hypothetical protein
MSESEPTPALERKRTLWKPLAPITWEEMEAAGKEVAKREDRPKQEARPAAEIRQAGDRKRRNAGGAALDGR